MTDRLVLDETHLGATPPFAEAEAALAKFSEAAPAFLDLLRDEDMARRCAGHAAAAPSWVEDVVVLGIGGSALAGRGLVGVLGSGSARRIHFLDTVDPEAVERAFFGWDLFHTLFCVISKSGRTLETRALFEAAWERLTQELGVGRAR